MACVPTPNVTFLGDTILMKYQHVMLNRPLSQLSVPDTYRNAVEQKYHCDFCVERLQFCQLRKYINLLLSLNYEIKGKVVIMLGTYDIITGDVCVKCYLTRKLLLLIEYLAEQNSRDIAICTIPRICGMTSYSKSTLELYNACLRWLPDNNPINCSITVLDVNELLHGPSAFESDRFTPSAYGFYLMHELIKEFIEN